MDDKLFENIYNESNNARESDHKTRLSEATYDLLDQIVNNFFEKEDKILDIIKGENA